MAERRGGSGGEEGGWVNGGVDVMSMAVVKWRWRCEGRSKCRKWQVQKLLESRIVWIKIYDTQFIPLGTYSH
jgi:hypothetical protein